MKIRTVALICALCLSVVLMAGCGKNGGESSDHSFTIGEYTYKLGDIEKRSDSENTYDVTLLIEGNTAPIIISGGTTKSGIDMELVSDNDTYTYTNVSFDLLPDDEKDGNFGGRAIFSFHIPGDSDFPDKAIVINASDTSETKELDISGISVE